MKKSLLVLSIGTCFALTANAHFYIQADLGVSKLKSNVGVVEYSQRSGDVIPASGAPNYVEGAVPLDGTTYDQRLSLGYKFNPVRVALDYTHYSKIKQYHQYSAGWDKIEQSHTLKLESTGLSAVYDFDMGSKFKPFIGMRVSFNRLNSQYTSNQQAPLISWWSAPYNEDDLMGEDNGDELPFITVQGAPEHRAAVPPYAPILDPLPYYPIDTIEPQPQPQPQPLPEFEVVSEKYNSKLNRIGVGLLIGASYELTPHLSLVSTAEYNYLGKFNTANMNNYSFKLGLRYSF